MNQLHLHIGEEIQGVFTPKKYNLMLTFQVNCPGCFTYALPMFRRLNQQYADQIGFLGLSTAFEDFELNTPSNTKLLIEKGELVGQTKKVLSEQGLDRFPFSLDFPIASDAKMEESQRDEVIEKICQINPNYNIWADYDKNLLRLKVNEYLNIQKEISLTFTLNQFRGTPTFVLFDSNYQIIDSWFGHVDSELISDKIKEVLTLSN